MKKQNLAVMTGGTGLIGYHVLKALIDDSWRVIVLHRKTSDVSVFRGILDSTDSVELKEVDLGDERSIDHVFPEGVDAVFHLAANVSHHSDKNQWRDNVLATRNLAEVALEKEALKNKTNVADFYSNQGVFYLAKNEERLAIESFRKALELDSTHVEASVNLGGIYLKGFDYDRAYVALENAFEKGHREFRFLLNYAIAARQKGKYSLSEDIYKGLLKQQPHHREALYNYSLLLIEGLKSYDKGLDVIQKLKFIGEPKGTHNKIKQLEEIAKGGVQ